MSDVKPIAWETQDITLAPGENWYATIRLNAAEGWEPWHMERSENGHRTIYFKRPKVLT